MTRESGKTFVGFGFGPIQSGLFLLEAFASGNFSRFVVAEIDTDLVAAVRAAGGRYNLNVAHSDHIEPVALEGIELLNPTDATDRERLLETIGESDELATALPSVRFYNAGGPASVAALIGQGLARREAVLPTVIYAAENHNHAAEFLAEAIGPHCRPGKLQSVQTLNTVIGKMSGVITDPPTTERMGLVTITPEIPRAILVEEFNRILISRVELSGYRRGIDVFVEKDDLLPFEEAKLYGHNAIHALIGYLADLAGLETMAQAGQDDRIMQIAREAFIEESGEALIRRHEALGDPLFTPEGYREYADDLLERMINPNLNDLVWRVGRDHVRKLGYEDRLYGTMRLALRHEVQPRRLALGAAAGVVSMIRRKDELATAVEGMVGSVEELTRPALDRLLRSIWGDSADEHAATMIDLTWAALKEAT